LGDKGKNKWGLRDKHPGKFSCFTEVEKAKKKGRPMRGGGEKRVALKNRRGGSIIPPNG